LPSPVSDRPLAFSNHQVAASRLAFRPVRNDRRPDAVERRAFFPGEQAKELPILVLLLAALVLAALLLTTLAALLLLAGLLVLTTLLPALLTALLALLSALVLVILVWHYRYPCWTKCRPNSTRVRSVPSL
jgi:hypothetical protein